MIFHHLSGDCFYTVIRINNSLDSFLFSSFHKTYFLWEQILSIILHHTYSKADFARNPRERSLCHPIHHVALETPQGKKSP